LGIILRTEFLTKNTFRRLVTQDISHAPRRPDDIGHAPAPFPHVLCPAAVATPHCNRSAWEMPCRRRLSGLQHMAVLQYLGKVKRILDRLRNGTTYVDDKMAKKDTLRALATDGQRVKQQHTRGIGAKASQ